MPRIRYTIGPERLYLGALELTRDLWSEPVSDELAEQALLPDRQQEYGFEKAEDQPAPAAAGQTEE